jgi:hypothetical protein
MVDLPHAPPPVPPPPPQRRWIPFVLLVATLLVPTLFWFKNSFARRLDDEKLRAFLSSGATATETQHALTEITRRIEEERQGRARGSNEAPPSDFYPLIVAVADATGPDGAEKRKTAAWTMQFDPQSEAFRSALLKLVADPDPLVAWNAATSLAIHGSAAARPVLLGMLKPHEAKAPIAGVFKPDARLEETLGVGSGGRLAKIEAPEGVVEMPSPVLGRVTWLAPAGKKVEAGEVVAIIAASQAAAKNALGALIRPGIGRAEDVAVIDAFLKATPDLEPDVKAQADVTKKALTSR